MVVELSANEALELSKNTDILLIEEDIIVTTNLSNSFELEVINDIDEEDYVPDEQITPWNIHAVKGSKEYLGENALQQGIKVGILDSGIEIMAEIEVAERINFTGIDDTGAFASMYEDMTGHGTAVAGIIGAIDDDMGIVGINPNADIYSLKVFDDNNQAPLSRIIEAIQYAIDNDIKILNMSFGTTVNSMALYLKIRDAYEAGMLMVASAGNKGVIEYPAAYDEVMAVGATNMENQIAPMSSSGTQVDIAAPGTPVLSTGLLGGYIVTEGTSIAAPHVAAAASLLWAKDTTKNADFIRQLLYVSARRIDNGNSGNGLLDIANAFAIYEQFSEVYLPNETIYDQVADNYSDLEDFNEEYVVGSWNNAANGHYGTIDDTGYLTGNFASLMKLSCARADSGPYGATSAAQIKLILHGGTVDKDSYGSSPTGQNYVSDIRYLYAAACNLYNGLAIPSKSSYPTASQGIDTIVNELLSHSFGTTYETNSATINEAKAAKVLGYAAHLAGDVYAHRTIVSEKFTNTNDTKYFLAGGSCSDATIKKQAFLKTITEDEGIACGHINCINRGITLGVIESKDITTWLKISNLNNGGNSTFEDKITYLPNRFAGASFSVKYIMGRFRTRASLTASLFLPDNNSVTFGMEINGLQKFYTANGWSTTGTNGNTTILR